MLRPVPPRRLPRHLSHLQAHVASKSVHPGACGAYTSMCTTPSAIVFVFALADQLEPIAVYRLVVQSVRWGSSAAAPVDAFSRVDQVVRP